LDEVAEVKERHPSSLLREGFAAGVSSEAHIRYERCSERFHALAILACSVICFSALQQPPR
jgi:hypothetical protein